MSLSYFQIVDKWKTSPVLVSFDSSVTPISEIPFPALTICNYNKVRKSRIEHLEEKMKKEPNNGGF
jgi:amiloride-sensitive sodium channel